MPISFFQSSPIYTINYPALFDFLNSQIIFKSYKAQKDYLCDWIDYLQYLDHKITSHFLSGGSFPNIEVSRNQRTEIFEAAFVCEDGVIRIHFAISKLLLLLDDELTDEDISYEAISSFASTNSVVAWIPPSTALSDDLHKSDPILIAQYPVGKYKFFVIDGNHRLGYSINNNYEQIPVITLNPTLLLKKDVFASKFDEALYILLLEANGFYLKTRERGIAGFFYSSKALKTSSYLYTKNLSNIGQ